MQRDELSKDFNLQTFKQLVTNLVETELYSEARDIHHSSQLISDAQNIGHFLDNRFNSVLVITHSATVSARVKLATDTFKLMADNNIDKALVAFVSTTDEEEWRFSYISILLNEVKGKIKKTFSNPRRYSYILGPKAKTLTPYQYLIQKGTVKTLEELQKRFSLEVVNNEFYKEIAKLYDDLVGTDKKDRLLKHPSIGDQAHEFAVRLIGRIIFCWFLREKKSSNGISLIPDDILSKEASHTKDYYHTILAPLFFEVLNRPFDNRTPKFTENGYSKIPYLNGGLFSDDDIDQYKFDKSLEISVPGIVDVPDVWLQRLFDLLERFNFTVDENTSFDTDLSIDPEMLGRVFENLLARINPETGETVRKSTGSFYTPREIVDYMVDSSLIEYLADKTDVDRVKLEALVSYELLDDMGNELDQNEGEKVLEALSTLTVLDPACGSGAFPIGMLQKIVFVLTILDPEAKWWLKKQLQGATPELRREFENKGVDYIRKLGVIRQTIYGVDIQPIATEISRLRCFLTLVVDELIDDNQENRGIKPLPNLEFKFVTANSLVKPPTEDSEINTSLFEDFGARLSGKVRDYFGAHGPEKISLLHDIRDLIDDKVDQNTSYVLNNYGLYKDDRFTDAYNQKNVSRNTKLLKDADSWKSYKNIFKHKPVNFFETKYFFPEVETGFDVVIGNPPYIRHRDLPKAFKDYLKDIFATGNTTSDIYCYFYELSFNLLRDGGFGTYITSNKWLRANYGKNIRSFLKKNTKIVEVIDLGSNQFNAATVDTNTILYQKIKPNIDHEVIFNVSIPKLPDEEITIDQEDLSEDGFSFANKKALALLEKIEKTGKRLKDLESLKINYGVLTGRNEVKTAEGKEGVFILSEAEAQALINKDEKSKEMLKPILRGRDIKRYDISWARKYLLAIYYGFNTQIDNYPAIKEHLIKHEATLRSRAQVNRGDHHWMELDQNPSQSFMEEFSEKKIVFPIISSVPSFSLDEHGYFHNDKAFHIIGDDLEYVIAFLNSKLSDWTIHHYGPTLGSGGFEYRKIFIEKLPLVVPGEKNSSLVQQIKNLVVQINNSTSQEKNHEYEEKIDNLFYELYDLTSEEIELIEGTKNE